MDEVPRKHCPWSPPRSTVANPHPGLGYKQLASRQRPVARGADAGEGPRYRNRRIRDGRAGLEGVQSHGSH